MESHELFDYSKEVFEDKEGEERVVDYNTDMDDLEYNDYLAKQAKKK